MEFALAYLKPGFLQTKKRIQYREGLLHMQNSIGLLYLIRYNNVSVWITFFDFEENVNLKN